MSNKSQEALLLDQARAKTAAKMEKPKDEISEKTHNDFIQGMKRQKRKQNSRERESIRKEENKLKQIKL